MVLHAASRDIERVLVIDDEKSVRDGYQETLRDCGIDSIPEAGPIMDIREYVAKKVRDGVQAVLSDHHLTKSNYSSANGAELVAQFYSQRFPAILCTRWANATQDEIRKNRKQIPVLLSFEELDPDSVTSGLTLCVREFEGKMVASRMPWRTLVRIEGIESHGNGRAFIIVPGWNPNQVLNVSLDLMPESVRRAVKNEEVSRVFAKVNVGAERDIDLFFDGWELPHVE